MVYVVVPQTTGALLLETHDGPITSQLTSGVSYTRPVGVEHNVVNPGPGEFVSSSRSSCARLRNKVLHRTAVRKRMQ